MRQQQGHRIRLIKAREVKEVAVLPEGPLAIGVVGGQRRGRNHRSGGPELLHQQGASTRVDAGVEAVHSSRALQGTGWQLALLN